MLVVFNIAIQLISISLPSKMATNTMVSGHYAVDPVLVSSGAPLFTKGFVAKVMPIYYVY